MKWLNGWTAALGALGVAAVWNSRRAGEMTATRDAIYQKCLRGEEPVDKMRAIANAFEKARCYPQARMLRLRVELLEQPPEVQEQYRAAFQKAMASRDEAGVLRVAAAFEARGATSSAAKLRRHAQALEKARTSPESSVVTPEPGADPALTPQSEPPSNPEPGTEPPPSDPDRTEPTEPAIPVPKPETLNGKSHVAVSTPLAATAS